MQVKALQIWWFLTFLCWLPSADSIFLGIQVMDVRFLCTSRTPSGKHKSLLDLHLGMSDQSCSGSVCRPSGKSKQSPRCHQIQPVPRASIQYPGEHKGFLGRCACLQWVASLGRGVMDVGEVQGEDWPWPSRVWARVWVRIWAEEACMGELVERREGERAKALQSLHCSLDIFAWQGSLSVTQLILEGASPCFSLCWHVPPCAVTPSWQSPEALLYLDTHPYAQLSTLSEDTFSHHCSGREIFFVLSFPECLGFILAVPWR